MMLPQGDAHEALCKLFRVRLQDPFRLFHHLGGERFPRLDRVTEPVLALDHSPHRCPRVERDADLLILRR